MIKKVFIIVPSAVDASPIKGAAALANALSQWVSVIFITLKQGTDNFVLLDDNVKLVSLGEYNWYLKIKVLRELLKKSGDKDSIAAISSSFSADFINSLCTDLAITCASVRGNLPINYVNTYGFLGKLIAYFHLKRLIKISHVVSMTVAMAEQVQTYINRKSPVIGNFINEPDLFEYKKTETGRGPYKIVFSGSLCNRKQPLLLVESVSCLIAKGYKFELSILGDGPLLVDLKNKVKKLNLEANVTFCGYLQRPFEFISRSDILVLPSLSEGVSRSALEALFLGVPSVLRNVDGAEELIQEGLNGSLFKEDSELQDAIIRAIELSRSFSGYKNLLPDKFRQQSAAKEYLKLLEYDI